MLGSTRSCLRRPRALHDRRCFFWKNFESAPPSGDIALWEHPFWRPNLSPPQVTYTLEEVLGRSRQLREGLGDLAREGQRAFLTLTGAKLNARVFPGRQLEADYSFCLGSSGKPVVLGLGMSGPVREVLRRTDGRRCAVKSFRKSRLDTRQMRLLRNEAQIFLEVDHPNIVRLLGCYEDARELHLVMERCKGGEVYGELLRRRHYGEEETADIVRQMLFTLRYLHENSIVHRDLKLENWMLEESRDFARVKLIDFGLSRIWDPQDVHGSLQRSCGSVDYMAPEVLDGSYGQKADMWSLGVIVFMLLSGKCPFRASSCNGFTRDVVLSRIRECNYVCEGETWAHLSPEARDFVNRLLEKDPDRRMDASEALNHPWMLPSCSIPQGVAHGRADRCSRRCAPVDGRLLRGWRRFASLSPVLQVMLVELAFAGWSEGMTDGFQELFAEQSQHRGTMQFEDFRKLARQASPDVDDGEMENLFRAMVSARGRVSGWEAFPQQIGYSEFLASSLPGLLSQQELLEHLFRMLDMDGCGSFHTSRFRAILSGTSVTEADVDVSLASLGAGVEGRITAQQFINAFWAQSWDEGLGHEV
eukprot:TRINITY_DN33213_c0_g1_i1.p1 TRINITY_DN33213_c0_g1~~TRINITY_DN33213_c0_g1_i1.p1  ORF type:complete len:588 (+),score=115.96 TRINITY_DN33213_c0_g1_i1:42-1805(+)